MHVALTDGAHRIKPHIRKYLKRQSNKTEKQPTVNMSTDEMSSNLKPTEQQNEQKQTDI